MRRPPGSREGCGSSARSSRATGGSSDRAGEGGRAGARHVAPRGAGHHPGRADAARDAGQIAAAAPGFARDMRRPDRTSGGRLKRQHTQDDPDRSPGKADDHGNRHDQTAGPGAGVRVHPGVRWLRGLPAPLGIGGWRIRGPRGGADCRVRGSARAQGPASRECARGPRGRLAGGAIRARLRPGSPERPSDPGRAHRGTRERRP